MKTSIFLLYLFALSNANNIQPDYEPPAKETLALYSIMKSQLNDVKTNLEKFNSLYLINLDQRMLNIMTTMTSLDTNIKTLQERAQVWDIFQHHIGAWSEHIKSVDNKLDLLKRAQEDTTSPHPLDTRMQNLEFKVQHIFEKVDVINEKLHDITKTVYSLSSLNHRGRRNERVEAFDHNMIMNKLNTLQKRLDNVQKKNGKPKNQEEDDEFDDLLDKLTAKKLKELVSSRKNTRSLDNIMNILRSVDDRTVRIYDLEANQFERILSCCKRTDHEITTFTNSADILLKRIESLVLNVDGKLEKKCVNTTKVIEPSEEIGSGDEENEPEIINTPLNIPKTIGCHQVKSGKSGIYTFGSQNFNFSSRDFNKRYCLFIDEGPAWTLIQNRYENDIQENFNRSWNEYKEGFGDLRREFWFGNDFIHKLTFEDNMVLRVEIEDFDKNFAWAEYATFRIDSEKFNYNLIIADYKGNATDSLSYHNDQDFSTYDRNNDKSNSTLPCAFTYGGGWWFDKCAESNLNGIYNPTPTGHNYIGVLWENWVGDYSLKTTRMMIRPKDFWFDENGNFLGSSDILPQDP